MDERKVSVIKIQLETNTFIFFIHFPAMFVAWFVLLHQKNNVTNIIKQQIRSINLFDMDG